MPMGSSFLTDITAVKHENWHMHDCCPDLAKFTHLAAISAFFLFSGPTLETTLISSWDMFGSYNVLHASWIIFYISAAMPGAVPDLSTSFCSDLLFCSMPMCSDVHQPVVCQGSSSTTEIPQGFFLMNSGTRRLLRSIQ